MKQMSSKKFWFYIFLAMFIGFVIAPSGETKVEEKIVTQEVVKNEAEWKQLKEIDDRGFSLAAEGMGACSETLIAASNFDVDGINAGTEKLQDLATSVNSLALERQEVLVKLGY